MRRNVMVLIRVGAALALFLSAGGWAQESGAAAKTSNPPEKTANIQLSLFPPIQLYDTRTSIEGFRLGIFALNANITGLDIGLLNWTTRDFVGVEWSIVDIVEEDAGGIQFSTVNVVGEGMAGWQVGLVNVDGNGFVGFQDAAVNVIMGKKGLGFALGAFNYADAFTGLQLGLVNYSRELYGIQIGIANIASSAKIPVLPIVNANF